MADKLGVAWTWLLIAGHMKMVPRHFNKKSKKPFDLLS